MSRVISPSSIVRDSFSKASGQGSILTLAISHPVSEENKNEIKLDPLTSYHYYSTYIYIY